jgi:hypothetical protein
MQYSVTKLQEQIVSSANHRKHELPVSTSPHITCKTTGSRRGTRAAARAERARAPRRGRGKEACVLRRRLEAACSGGVLRLRAPAAARGCVLRRRLEAACSGGGSRRRAPAAARGCVLRRRLGCVRVFGERTTQTRVWRRRGEEKGVNIFGTGFCYEPVLKVTFSTGS